MTMNYRSVFHQSVLVRFVGKREMLLEHCGTRLFLSRHATFFFWICILFAWFINCVLFFEKKEESQHRNEETFDDVGILDTLRITLGGFARNTSLADRTRQCVSRPLAVIIR